MAHQNNTSTTLEDFELLRLAQEGDRSALSELIKRYENKIYNYAMRFVQNKEDAEDILQETFLSMIKAVKTFRGESGFATWIYKIATNTALMKIRTQRRIFESLEEDTIDLSRDYQGVNLQLAESPLENLQNKELMDNIIHSLDTLPPKHRSVFLLRDVEGFSTEEVSSILNMSSPAVKSNLRRARIALRDKLVDFISYERK